MRSFLMIAVAATIALSYGEARASVDCVNSSGAVTCTNGDGAVENWFAGKKYGASEIIACSWVDDGYGNKTYNLEDTVSYAGTGLAKLILVGNSNDEIIFIEDATLTYDEAEGCKFYNFPDVPSEIYGDQGADNLHGTDHGSYIYGEWGDDVIFGDADIDHLYGGDNADELWGYGSDDYLSGGTGRDDLHGGDGDDTLYAGGVDNIRDYLYCDEGSNTDPDDYAWGGEKYYFYPDTQKNTLCYYCDTCDKCVDMTGTCG